MHEALDRLIAQHNLVLLWLSFGICVFGSVVTARLLVRSIDGGSLRRAGWVFLGGNVAAATAWCTHFVSLLAYEPGVSFGFDVLITLLSFALASIGMTMAFGLFSMGTRITAITGGLLFGISLVALQYLGVASIAAGGIAVFDTQRAGLSIALSLTIAAFVFERLRREGAGNVVVMGGILSLAALSLHVFGLASVTITQEPDGDTILFDPAGKAYLGMAVVVVAVVIAGAGALVYALDEQTRRLGDERLRHLLESTVDGMAITRDGIIVQANAALALMTGMRPEALVGRPIMDFFDDDGHGTLPERELIPLRLRSATGSTRSVELALHTERFSRTADPLTVYAIRDITHRIAQEERIAYLAQYDSLTGLRNRASFLERTTRLLERQDGEDQFAVLLVDLDFFKEINDTHGHAAGDEVLRAAAARLKAMLGRGEIAARLGGDEFAVMARLRRREDVVAFAERVCEAFSTPVHFEHTMLRFGCSVGVARFPDDGESIRVLLNNADLAMYRAKRSKISYCFYDRSMDDRIRTQRRLVDDLRAALDRGELEVHYQVQMRLSDDAVAGYEALARWNHPERGPIPPAVFIPIAEEHGLASKLGRLVLETACRDASQWPEDLTVAVNVSPRQLRDDSLVQTVAATLAETGLAPSRLELEVTESCFISDSHSATHMLHRLRHLGVGISIDDFGAGYSSLAMLQWFPFDKIKLDKTFSESIPADTKALNILRAMLSLAHMLNVPVMAEGVESIEQLHLLRDEGCDYVQGFIFGAAGPAPEPMPCPPLQAGRLRLGVPAAARIA